MLLAPCFDGFLITLYAIIFHYSRRHFSCLRFFHYFSPHYRLTPLLTIAIMPRQRCWCWLPHAAAFSPLLSLITPYYFRQLLLTFSAAAMLRWWCRCSARWLRAFRWCHYFSRLMPMPLMLRHTPFYAANIFIITPAAVFAPCCYADFSPCPLIFFSRWCRY